MTVIEGRGKLLGTHTVEVEGKKYTVITQFSRLRNPRPRWTYVRNAEGLSITEGRGKLLDAHTVKAEDNKYRVSESRNQAITYTGTCIPSYSWGLAFATLRK